MSERYALYPGEDFPRGHSIIPSFAMRLKWAAMRLVSSSSRMTSNWVSPIEIAREKAQRDSEEAVAESSNARSIVAVDPKLCATINSVIGKSLQNSKG